MAFEELLNNYSEKLGLSNIILMSHFMAADFLPEAYVSEQYDGESDGLIGIDALCLYKRLHFNMNDMTLTVE